MRSEITLNIGMRNNPLERATSREIAAFVKMWAEPRLSLVEDSLTQIAFVSPLDSVATELTAVVRFDVDSVSSEELGAALMHLCTALTQGAIAAYVHPQGGDAEGYGVLIGPRAHVWGGIFNAAFFADGANIHAWEQF